MTTTKGAPDAKPRDIHAYLAEFDDIPGTRVYTAARARKGYHINQFAMSLMNADNRARFKADERAYLDEKDFNYLYEDDMGYNFMHPETFDQITISRDVVGDQGQWLQEGMTCLVALHEGNPISIELPARVTLEIIEADPVVKGQTASSSYKPAKLSNGARVMVPPHIGTGTRVVVMTVDGSYVERAKDGSGLAPILRRAGNVRRDAQMSSFNTFTGVPAGCAGASIGTTIRQSARCRAVIIPLS